MKLTIIITNFNYLNYLPSCLESVLHQNPDELIVVDDGSTDGSQEWLRSQAADYKILYKRNGGQASAMNLGFKHSTGDLVWFVDADDLLLPEVVAEVRSSWESDTSLLQIRCKIVDATTKFGRDFPRRFVTLPYGDIRIPYSLLTAYPKVPTSGSVFSRKFLERVFPIPESPYRICADSFLQVWAPVYGSLFCINYPMIGYRVHGKNAFAGVVGYKTCEALLEKIERTKIKYAALLAASRKMRERKLGMFTFLLSPDYISLEFEARRFNFDLIKLLNITDQNLEGVRESFIVKIIFWIMRFELFRMIYSKLWAVLLLLVYFSFNASMHSSSECNKFKVK